MHLREKLKFYAEKFSARDDEPHGQEIDNKHAAVWMGEHIPLLDCQDPVLEEIYYFRWWVYRKHIKKTPEGYILTEFLPQVPWSGPYNGISCAAGHHLMEGRWLRGSDTYLRDYCVYWFLGSGREHEQDYSNWLIHAVYRFTRTTGNYDLASELFPYMEDSYKRWKIRSLHRCGLFWSSDNRDGMEYSAGGNGIRLTLNSYMAAAASALSRIAGWKGDKSAEERYQREAESIWRRMQTMLWRPELNFYRGIRVQEKTGTPGEMAEMDEITGYLPWYFGLPFQFEGDAQVKRMGAAFSRLFDRECFYAPYGPSTCSRYPGFLEKKAVHPCLWNGWSWPFSTSQTLTAAAEYLQKNREKRGNTEFGRREYGELLLLYAGSHYRTDRYGRKSCWIDENLHPDTGEWEARRFLKEQGFPQEAGGYERGKDYNHSTFCDLIISGAAGIHMYEDGRLTVTPLLDHRWKYFKLEDVPAGGHLVTVQYDKTGERYGSGSGFQIYADGRLQAGFDSVPESVTCIL